MPAIRNDSTKDKRSRARVPVQCPSCDRVVNRKADLTRHMATHNKDAGKYNCHYEDCTYATLQKSNLTTHLRTHTGEKRFECKDDPANCDFRTSDPAAFTRHRKKKHGYVPQARSRKGSVATEVELPDSPKPNAHISAPTSGTNTGAGTPAADRSINAVREEDEGEGKGGHRTVRRKSNEEDPMLDDDHPSPAPSDSDDDSDSSSSSSGPRSRVCSRESSVSEVDEFIAKTIDSLKHVVGRRQRGSSQATAPANLSPPAVLSPPRTVMSPPRHQPVSFERRGGPD
ncbi:hypothetical protein FA13DRAFT_1786767 [Coprinellus micaceus]|uniref:C2H2-type domain-containing protein n=1 Tax=Coprinellus micaceus TaxID=71717 RepID=A0A4Y7TVF1_COPMI|nr:hypothetical protein FA13DRAFT_1786767 [Coprinellus micaceus]